MVVGMQHQQQQPHASPATVLEDATTPCVGSPPLNTPSTVDIASDDVSDGSESSTTSVGAVSTTSMAMAMPAMVNSSLYSNDRVKLREVNPHLICVLCHGYFVDATSIAECLHSFCRSCIILQLGTESCCPICKVQINNSKPHLSLKPDKTLQDIVYKLVPGLFHAEMKRRNQFYQSHPDRDLHLHPESRGITVDRLVYSPQDSICLSLEYYDKSKEKEEWETVGSHRVNYNTSKLPESEISLDDENGKPKKYFVCPAAVRVMYLKKLIRLKYNLEEEHKVELFYRRESLPDEYSLMDIAYIYAWKRNSPMRLYYKINILTTVAESPDKIAMDAIEQNSSQLSPASEQERAVVCNSAVDDDDNDNQINLDVVRRPITPLSPNANVSKSSKDVKECDEEHAVHNGEASTTEKDLSTNKAVAEISNSSTPISKTLKSSLSASLTPSLTTKATPAKTKSTTDKKETVKSKRRPSPASNFKPIPSEIKNPTPIKSYLSISSILSDIDKPEVPKKPLVKNPCKSSEGENTTPSNPEPPVVTLPPISPKLEESAESIPASPVKSTAPSSNISTNNDSIPAKESNLLKPVNGEPIINQFIIKTESTSTITNSGRKTPIPTRINSDRKMPPLAIANSGRKTPMPTIANSGRKTPTPATTNSGKKTPVTTITNSGRKTPITTLTNSDRKTTTPTLTNSGRKTPTPTLTNSGRKTPTPTLTNSGRKTPTSTLNQTLAITNSDRETTTPTPTNSDKETATPTPTNSDRKTPTPTLTNSGRNTPTPTLTNCGRKTPTPLITNSGRKTPTPSTTNSGRKTQISTPVTTSAGKTPVSIVMTTSTTSSNQKTPIMTSSMLVSNQNAGCKTPSTLVSSTSNSGGRKTPTNMPVTAQNVGLRMSLQTKGTSNKMEIIRVPISAHTKKLLAAASLPNLTIPNSNLKSPSTTSVSTSNVNAKTPSTTTIASSATSSQLKTSVESITSSATTAFKTSTAESIPSKVSAAPSPTNQSNKTSTPNGVNNSIKPKPSSTSVTSSMKPTPIFCSKVSETTKLPPTLIPTTSKTPISSSKASPVNSVSTATSLAKSLSIPSSTSITVSSSRSLPPPLITLTSTSTTSTFVTSKELAASQYIPANTKIPSSLEISLKSSKNMKNPSPVNSLQKMVYQNFTNGTPLSNSTPKSSHFIGKKATSEDTPKPAVKRAFNDDKKTIGEPEKKISRQINENNGPPTKKIFTPNILPEVSITLNPHPEQNRRISPETSYDVSCFKPNDTPNGVPPLAPINSPICKNIQNSPIKNLNTKKLTNSGVRIVRNSSSANSSNKFKHSLAGVEKANGEPEVKKLHLENGSPQNGLLESMNGKEMLASPVESTAAMQKPTEAKTPSPTSGKKEARHLGIPKLIDIKAAPYSKLMAQDGKARLQFLKNTLYVNPSTEPATNSDNALDLSSPSSKSPSSDKSDPSPEKKNLILSVPPHMIPVTMAKNDKKVKTSPANKLASFGKLDNKVKTSPTNTTKSLASLGKLDKSPARKADFRLDNGAPSTPTRPSHSPIFSKTPSPVGGLHYSPPDFALNQALALNFFQRQQNQELLWLMHACQNGQLPSHPLMHKSTKSPTGSSEGAFQIKK